MQLKNLDMDESKRIMNLHNQLMISNKYDIPTVGKVKICQNQGVYIIYSQTGSVLHVGKTNGGKNGIDQRLLNHVRNQSSFSKLYMQPNKVNLRGTAKFQFIEVEDARSRSLLEALTAGLLCPVHIGLGTKKITQI